MYHVHRSTEIRRSRFTTGSRRKEKGFRRQQTQMETGQPDVSDTRSHCEYAERTLLSECAVTKTCGRGARGRNSHTCLHLKSAWIDQLSSFTKYAEENRQCVSHFTECAEDKSRTSLSTRIGPNKGYCTPRSAQARIRTAQSARTETCSWQSLPSGDGAMYHS